MRRFAIRLIANALIFGIDLQLKNRYLPDWARKELEDDKAEFERTLAQQRRASRRT